MMVSSILLAVAVVTVYFINDGFPLQALPGFSLAAAITFIIRRQQNYIVLNDKKLIVVNKTNNELNKEFSLDNIDYIEIKKVMLNGYNIEIRVGLQIDVYSVPLLGKKESSELISDLLKTNIQIGR